MGTLGRIRTAHDGAPAYAKVSMAHCAIPQRDPPGIVIEGCGATVSSLRREKIGPFDIADALPLDAARALEPAALAERLLHSLPALDRALKAALVK